MRDDREHFTPLGAPLPRQVKQKDTSPKQVEGARKGVLQGADGKLQTDIPLPAPESYSYTYITPWIFRSAK